MKRVKIKLEFKDIIHAISEYSKAGKEPELIILNKDNYDLFICNLDSISQDNIKNSSSPSMFGYPVFRSEDMSYNEFIIA